MKEEAGKRNCLGFISHVKDFQFAIYYIGKPLNDYQNRNDKKSIYAQEQLLGLGYGR